MNIQDWLPLGLTGLISLLFKGLSRVFSNTIVQKHQFFSAQLSLWSSSYIHIWLLEKNIALTIWTFAGKVMSLLFNALSRFVIAFLPRSKHLNFMAVVTVCSDFRAQENKICHCFHCFPIYLTWSDGTRCHVFDFWMLNFKPAFSLSSFTFTKRLFTSSFSAIKVVSSAYLRLLIFLLAILIPAWDLSSLAFIMMYSAYKLNKQGANIQPWCTPFPIWNQSIAPFQF